MNSILGVVLFPHQIEAIHNTAEKIYTEEKFFLGQLGMHSVDKSVARQYSCMPKVAVRGYLRGSWQCGQQEQLQTMNTEFTLNSFIH